MIKKISYMKKSSVTAVTNQDFLKIPKVFKAIYKLICLRFSAGILRDKTMVDKLMFIPNDDKLNLTLEQKFGHS